MPVGQKAPKCPLGVQRNLTAGRAFVASLPIRLRCRTASHFSVDPWSTAFWCSRAIILDNSPSSVLTCRQRVPFEFRPRDSLGLALSVCPLRWACGSKTSGRVDHVTSDKPRDHALITSKPDRELPGCNTPRFDLAKKHTGFLNGHSKSQEATIQRRLQPDARLKQPGHQQILAPFETLQLFGQAAT